MNKNPTISLATLRDAHRIAAMSRDYVEQGLGWRWRARGGARTLVSDLNRRAREREIWRVDLMFHV